MKRLPPHTAALMVVALALFTDALLYYLLVPLLPAYARQYGLSQMGVGVLFGSYSVSLLLGTYPLGLLADRVGRRAPMVWGLVGLFATTLLFAFAHSYPLLILARVLQGLSAAATWTAGLALLADHFPDQARGKAMGTAFAMANLGVLLGPTVSGWLSQHHGLRAPFFLAAGLIVLDAVARLTLLEDVAVNGDAQLGFRELLGNATIRVFAGAMALGAGLWALLEATLPLYFDRQLHLTATTIGLCFGAAALTHLATSPLMGALSDRVGRKRVLMTGLVAAVVLIPLPVFVHGLGPLLGVMAAAGLLASFIMSPASPALADAVAAMGSQSYASVFGILNLAYGVGLMAAPLLGSAAVQVVGLRVTLVGAGLLFGAYALRVRRLKL